MKYITLLAVLFSTPAYAQCTTPSCPAGQNTAWCRTATRADYFDANGRYCDYCTPNAGQCTLANGEDCVNDCRVCHDTNGTPWAQGAIYNCVTTNTPYPGLCSLCIPGVLQAVSCDPYYCGAIDAVHCRVRDCFTCP